MSIIIIKESGIQFKNPQIGQPTRAIEAHYNGRRITAYVNGKERLFRFEPVDLPFGASETDMITAIERALAREA